MSAATRDNRGNNRYEVVDGDDLAGFADYRLTGSRIAFTHTEILPAFAGKRLAQQLVADALDDARRRKLEVMPFCPYVRRFISKHADYIDLVPEIERERFGLTTSVG